MATETKGVEGYGVFKFLKYLSIDIPIGLISIDSSKLVTPSQASLCFQRMIVSDKDFAWYKLSETWLMVKICVS